MSDVILPIIDLDIFLASPDSDASAVECKKVSPKTDNAFVGIQAGAVPTGSGCAYHLRRAPSARLARV